MKPLKLKWARVPDCYLRRCLAGIRDPEQIKLDRMEWRRWYPSPFVVATNGYEFTLPLTWALGYVYDGAYLHPLSAKEIFFHWGD